MIVMMSCMMSGIDNVMAIVCGYCNGYMFGECYVDWYCLCYVQCMDRQ